MELKFKSYPKIPAFGYDGTEDILDGNITITPKIDGSNVSIWLGMGEYKLARRQGWLDDNDKGFSPFIEHIKKLWDESLYLKACADRNNWLVIFGEFSNNQNKLKYNLKVPIIVFDVAETFINVKDEEMHFGFYNYELMKEIADQAGLSWTPALYEGSGKAIGDVQKLIEKYVGKGSILGGCIEEGVVVKDYSRRTRFGRHYFAKIVTAEFAERQNVKTKPVRVGSGIGEWATETFFTPARLLKAVQKIKESGEWIEPETKKNIGKLIGVVTKDIYDEHYLEIAEKAAQVAWKEVNTMVAKQVAPTLDTIMENENVITESS